MGTQVSLFDALAMGVTQLQRYKPKKSGHRHSDLLQQKLHKMHEKSEHLNNHVDVHIRNIN